MDNFNLKKYLSNNLLLNEAFIDDKGELKDFNFNIEDDLIVKYTPEYYQNTKKYKYFYCEKGLTDDFEIKNGKKVKEIIGYSHFLDLPNDKKWILSMPNPYDELEKKSPGFLLDPDNCNDAEVEIIGYIYSKNNEDIETKYNEDDLQNAFYNSLGLSYD